MTQALICITLLKMSDYMCKVYTFILIVLSNNSSVLTKYSYGILENLDVYEFNS